MANAFYQSYLDRLATEVGESAAHFDKFKKINAKDVLARNANNQIVFKAKSPSALRGTVDGEFDENTPILKIKHKKNRENDPTKTSLQRYVVNKNAPYQATCFLDNKLSLDYDAESKVTSVGIKSYMEGYRKNSSPSYLGTRYIGEMRGDWVYYADGKKRVRYSALVNLLGVERKITEKWTNLFSEIDKIQSPFDISKKDSPYLGIFLDGSFAFFGKSQTNVYEMYNLYQGNKYYYGGVGNEIDGHMSEGVLASTFEKNITLAYDDILKFHKLRKDSNGGQVAKIQIFGFSRGAAQSVELARKLKSHGIEVEFVGLFDPVYSVAKPGQASRYVETTADSTNCNYVTVEISDNVKKAAVLYAAHEERAWFPATAFTYDSNKTTLIAGITPGNHCDAGGYFEMNGDFQWVSLYWMLEKAYGSHEHDPFAKGLTQAQWNAVIETKVAEVTQNPNAAWYWSDYRWETHLSVPGTNVSPVSTSRFSGVLPYVVHRAVLGKQPVLSKYPRKFSDFDYELEHLHDWLDVRNLLPPPNIYNYIDRPDDEEDK